MTFSSVVAEPGSPYPARPSERTRWILERRGERNRLDPSRPYAYLWEEEPGTDGTLVPTATLFLTNKECPYRCLMCDLWQNTLAEPTPLGAIPAQIDYALEQLPPACQIKLYNAGSFFDPAAIPEVDYAAIAARVSEYERVIVECHPALLTERTGGRALRFQALIPGRLEVAVGLETCNPEVLDRLNKRITVDSFRRAAEFLQKHEMDLRVFLLVRPPFLSEQEGVEWACRSLDFAFECGASVCCLIPTRAGNGAMEALQASGEFAPPSLRSLEKTLEYGLERYGSSGRRVFADLWDIGRFSSCPCATDRAARLERMNRTQSLEPPVPCPHCEADA